MSIRFYTRISKLEFKRRIRRAWRVGPDEVKTETEDLGWAVLLEGSTEWLFLGSVEPDEFEVGRRVVVTLEVVE